MRRIDRVLAILKEREWVSTAELENAEVGGTQGTRRLRELRAKGYVIEQRRKANSTQFQYKLLGEPDRDILLVGKLPPQSESSFEAHDGQPNRGRHIADGSVERRESLSAAPQPFVAWHGDTSRGFTVRHRGFGMSVRPFWGDGTWIFVVTMPDGSQVSGREPNLAAAKRAAYEATGL